MKSSRCPVCGRRKGRRSCPALHEQICATCCGTKRLTEIACPADCSYLAAAKVHPPAAEQRRRERDMRFLLGAVQGLTERQHRAFLFVQMFIRGYRPGALPALLDVDVAEAMGTLAATFETANKGIIYEHQTSSAPAQRLVTELKTALDRQRDRAPASLDRDLALALRRTETCARRAAATLDGQETDYLDVLDRLLPATPATDGPPEAAAAGHDDPSIIVP